MDTVTRRDVRRALIDDLDDHAARLYARRVVDLECAVDVYQTIAFRAVARCHDLATTVRKLTKHNRELLDALRSMRSDTIIDRRPAA